MAAGPRTSRRCPSRLRRPWGCGVWRGCPISNRPCTGSGPVGFRHEGRNSPGSSPRPGPKAHQACRGAGLFRVSDHARAGSARPGRSEPRPRARQCNHVTGPMADTVSNRHRCLLEGFIIQGTCLSAWRTENCIKTRTPAARVAVGGKGPRLLHWFQKSSTFRGKISILSVTEMVVSVRFRAGTSGLSGRTRSGP